MLHYATATHLLQNSQQDDRPEAGCINFAATTLFPAPGSMLALLKLEKTYYMNFEILSYQPQYQPYFERLNKAWIEAYFSVEPIDQWVLENPEEAIIKPGGQVYFAVYQGQIIGTAALKWNEAGIVELTKMAVDNAYQGLGAGKYLCQRAIEEAKAMGASKLVLYSHTSLKPAIGIYKKLGFVEVPVEAGKYARADIKMEIIFEQAQPAN